MRFVYLGPPDEPDVAGTIHAMTGEWEKGVPREVAEPAAVAWLSRHPHWAAVEDEAAEAVEGGGFDAHVADEPAHARRGRPRKVI